MASLALQVAGVSPEEVVNCPGGYRLGSRFLRCDAVHGGFQRLKDLRHQLIDGGPIAASWPAAPGRFSKSFQDAPCRPSATPIANTTAPPTITWIIVVPRRPPMNRCRIQAIRMSSKNTTP